MSTFKSVRVGGVPEHFNMPWHVAIDNQLFKKKNIDLKWSDYKTGTGAMLADLESGQLDMALLLTEGAIAGIANGVDIKILQWYVKSPLTWGIHTAYNSTISDQDSIFSHKYAISRIGSGSHLMAKVHAKQAGYLLEDEQFVIVNNLHGAEQALISNNGLVFYWEKYTTKYLVDQQIFKRLGEFVTPWPCFVLVAKNSFFTQNESLVQDIQNIINAICATFKVEQDAVKLIANKYNLLEEDVKAWLAQVEWNTIDYLPHQELDYCTDTLKSLNLLPANFQTSTLVFNKL